MTQEKTGDHIMAEAYEMYDKWVDEFKAAAENSNLEIDVDGLDLIMLIFIYNQECRAVEAALEEAQAGIARARELEREQYCQDICWMCGESKGKLIERQGEYWHKEGSWLTQCHATNIRQRWAQEKVAPATDGQ